MDRRRWSAAIAAACVAVFVGLELTVVAPAGAHEDKFPHIDYCHLWPGRTRVHWNLQEIRSFYINANVIDVHVEFDPRQVFPPFRQGFDGNENYVSDTNLGATRAMARLFLGNARFIDTPWVNCT